MNIRFFTIAVALLAFMMIGVASSSADPLELTIKTFNFDGNKYVQTGTTIPTTISDNSDGNACSEEYKCWNVGYTGDVGGWDIRLTAAYVILDGNFYANIGLESEAQSDLNANDPVPLPSKVEILVTKGGITAPITSWVTGADSGTKGGNTVLTKTYLSVGNDIHDLASFTNPAGASSTNDSDRLNSYALNIAAIITHVSQGTTTFNIDMVGIADSGVLDTVPEPSILLLLGIGLAVVQISRRYL